MSEESKTETRFVGFHRLETLPIKAGQTVTILKGTPIKQVGQPVRLAGRTYKVVVNHMLCGFENPERGIVQNPAVRWAGTGGYWCEVDINLIPEAK